MAKKIIGNLKLRIPAGRATAGPPVQHSVSGA